MSADAKAYVQSILREEKTHRALERVLAELKSAHVIHRSSKELRRVIEGELVQFEAKMVVEDKLRHLARIGVLVIQGIEQYTA